MSFNPTSTIHLCNVAIDNTYKNQIYFATKGEQTNYFLGKAVKSFSNYNVIRKTLPNGDLQSSVKVAENIDNLRNCNYMFYQNANHGTKFYYAFIVKLIYINEETTEIVFETDVYQTWLFDVELLPSFVVREHSKSDAIGDNLVPEKFNFQDYVYADLEVDNPLDDWGYLIASSEHFGEDGTRGTIISGVYQGLYFYYYESVEEVNNCLDQLESEGSDCVVFIALIPRFNIGATVDENGTLSSKGLVVASGSPKFKEIIVDITQQPKTFGDYTPKNNKLHTYPYECFTVSNHNGNEVEYRIEDFVDRDTMIFHLYGDVSANPSVTLFPINYQNVTMNYDCGISISGFPQCSFNSDTFKLWLAKNQFGIGMDIVSGFGQIVAGGVTALATGGAGSAIGVGQAIAGAQQLLNVMNTSYQMSKEPNKSTSGSAKTNLLTAIGFNCFTFYHRKIKETYARMVDDFFTMYGYQTNRVKTPNVSSRPYYNYVQTADINIRGGIPNDDMLKLKQMYNSGVTLWKSNATIGGYSVDNAP